jgi:phage baseplate assembly protein W
MTIPHLALPFQLNGDGSAQTVAQDSIDDVTQCVTVLVATETGSRVELPAYGIPDLTFAQGVPPVQAVIAAIGMWEPRAQVDVTAAVGPQASINVTVTTKNPGGTR